MCTIVTVAIISNNQWNKASFFRVIFQRLNHRPDFVVRDSWCFGWSQLLGWSDAGRATDWLSLGQPIWRGKSQNPCDCDCDVVGNSSEFVGMVFKRWLGTWDLGKNQEWMWMLGWPRLLEIFGSFTLPSSFLDTQKASPELNVEKNILLLTTRIQDPC